MAATPNLPSPPGEGAGPAGARRSTVLVVAGGDAAHPDPVLPPADLVVAADSGADAAVGHGLDVDVLVGDLDSVSDATLAALRSRGARIERHHPDKDATDLELALAVAASGDPGRIVLVGGHGGRLDHALAVPGALAAVARPGLQVEAWLGPAWLAVTGDEARTGARPGEQVSLLPWGGPASGVTTRGLRWALRDATLEAGSTRGVSNEVTEPPATVTVASGTLLVLRPHALDPSADLRPPVPDRPAGEGAR